MKKFFLPNGTITEFDGDLDLYNHYAVEFTAEQYAFADANPTATANEVKVCQMYTPPTRTAAQIVQEICDNYEQIEKANITAIGAIQLKEWCDADIVKAIAIKQWFTDLYTERATKIAQVNAGDLEVDTMPTSNEKPYTFYEIQLDVINN